MPVSPLVCFRIPADAGKYAVVCAMISVKFADAFFRAAAETLAGRLTSTAPQDMMNALTAFRKLEIPFGPLLETAHAFIVQQLASKSPSEMCLFLAVLAEVYSPTCQDVLRLKE